MDDTTDFIVCQRLMAGDGEFLGVDLLCDGQGKGAPFLIAALFVGRNGIVDLCLDTVVSEVSLEFVTTRAEYGEDVIDGIAQATSRKLVANEP